MDSKIGMTVTVFPQTYKLRYHNHIYNVQHVSNLDWSGHNNLIGCIQQERRTFFATM
jgi:hypothetical protein